jgi:hypothetical protein
VHFEATLASVLQNRPDDCEVLVVQPRSYEDPYDLSDEVRFLTASPTSSPVDLINVGVQLAKGSVVFVLSCDVEVVEGWTEPAMACFDDPTVGSVSPLIVRHHELTIVARGVRYGMGGRRKLRLRHSKRSQADSQYVVGPTLLAGFYRRQGVLDAGGFCRQLGEDLADVDMGLALQAIGYRAVHEDESIVTVGHAASKRPLSFRGGQQAERLFWRNAPLVRWVPSLLMHALTVVGEILGHLHRPAILLQTAGRAMAILEVSACRRHRQHLESVAARAERSRRSLSRESSGKSSQREGLGQRAAA